MEFRQYTRSNIEDVKHLTSFDKNYIENALKQKGNPQKIARTKLVTARQRRVFFSIVFFNDGVNDLRYPRGWSLI